MTALERLAFAFAEEHPMRVATLVETAPTEALSPFLEELTPQVAARVLAAAVPLAGARALGAMAEKPALAVLGRLNPQTAAQLLRRVPGASRRQLLAGLPGKARESIRALLLYGVHQVGSRCDPLAPAVRKHADVAHALDVVRQAAEGALHYVYVLDDESRLLGVASMRELMCAAPQEPVANIMVEHPQRLLADDPLHSVLAHPGWRKVHALPVVDESGRFIGAFRYSQFRALEAESGKAQSSGSRTQASSALAELYWLGASAMLNLGETAVLGQHPPRGEEK